MNRKQMKNEVSETKNRFRKITFFSFVSLFLFLASIVLIYTSRTTNNSKVITYNDKSNLDYKVFYKENDYFGSYVGKNQQYIASLIDHIETTFDYEMSMTEDINYSYYYYIDAEINVIDSNKKPLYQKKDEIIKRQNFNNYNKETFKIKKNVNLDYNYYNTIVNTFINRYNLRNTENYVTLKMYVGILGDCEGYYGSIKDNAVISMKIPLTTNTVNIDMNYNLSSGNNKELECIVENSPLNISLIFGIIFIISSATLAVYTYRYILKTRSPLTIYHQELKKIFNNYGRYISKIKTELKYDRFQIVLVEQFEDLFEARNSSQSPILFSQNTDKTKSVFVVPTNTGLVYIYYLAVGKNRMVVHEEKKQTTEEEII